MTKTHDAAFTISLPRTKTPSRLVPRFSKPEGDVMMHVKLVQDGQEIRHRLMIDENISSSWTYAAIMNGKTACNRSIADHFYAPIPAGITGDLCRDGCFTAPELANADRIRAKAEEQRHAEAEQEATEREHALAESRERTRRVKTGETQPIAKQDPPPELGVTEVGLEVDPASDPDDDGNGGEG